MMFQDELTGRGPARQALISVAKAGAAVLAAAALVQVSWNMFAPDLLGVQALDLRHALGAVVFAAVVAGGLRFAFGGVRRG